MTKFTFRLATLLKLREAGRDRRRNELAQAYQAERILQQQQDLLAEEIDENQRRSRTGAEPGKVNVDALLDMHRHQLVLRAQEELSQQQHTQLTAEIERRRLTLVEADRQVRVLEKLRQKQTVRHRSAEERLEMKQFDETASHQGGREEIG